MSEKSISVNEGDSEGGVQYTEMIWTCEHNRK